MVIQNILSDIEDHDIGAAVSHFLNCLFGNVTGGKASTNNVNAKNQKKVRVHYQSLCIYIVPCLFFLNYAISFFGAVYKAYLLFLIGIRYYTDL